MKMSRPDLVYVIIGCFFALICGSVEPIFAISIADFIKAFSIYELGSQELYDEILLWSMVALGIGLVLIIGVTIEYGALGKSGEELTLRLRDKAFRSMISQDMSYFDNPDNPVGILCSQLANDASGVQNATGIRVANVIKNFMTLAVSMTIGLYFCWQVALMALIFIPIIAIANAIGLKVVSGNDGTGSDKNEIEKCQNIVSESLRCIKTVTSLQAENHFLEKFKKESVSPTKKQKKNGFIIGGVMGLTDATLFLSYSLCFWFGAWLIDNEVVDSKYSYCSTT